MDASSSIGEGSSAAIKERIDQTRHQLGVKLGALEGQVRAVSSHARDVFRGRIDAARDVVDLRRQVVRHPWVWSGLAVGVGFMVGRSGRRRQRPASEPPRSSLVRGVVASQLATLQSVLVGRLLSFVAERVGERIVGASEGPKGRSPDTF